MILRWRALLPLYLELVSMLLRGWRGWPPFPAPPAPRFKSDGIVNPEKCGERRSLQKCGSFFRCWSRSSFGKALHSTLYSPSATNRFHLSASPLKTQVLPSAVLPCIYSSLHDIFLLKILDQPLHVLPSLLSIWFIIYFFSASTALAFNLR